MKLPKVFTGRRRKLFAWLVLNGLAQAVLGLAAVVTFERFHASGFSEGMAVLVLAGIATAIYAGRVLQRRHGEMFALDYVNETRLALLEKVLSLPDSARGAGLGLVTARLSADLLALKNWLSEGLANSIVQGMTLAMLLVGAALLYPQVAIVLACVVIPWGFAVLLLRPPLAQAIASARKQRGRLASLAGDQVVARLTLAHFGRTTPALNAVSRRAQALAKELIRRATFSEAMRASTELALPIASLAALWMISIGNGAAVPAAAPLLLLLGMTGVLLAGLSRSIDLQIAHQLAADRFAATFKAPGVDPGAADGPSSIKRGKPVELGLQWSDAAGNVSRHDVQPGSVVSLSGGTFDQRSGVLAAMARLRDDPRLTTTLAGQSASQIPIRDWRRIVTLTSPRLPLIRDTIASNLAIGAPSETPDDEVLDLARRFGIVTRAEEMQDPVEPTLMPVARALAMRLCRSLIRNASVILLDEATAASDFAMIAMFLELAGKRRITIITSGAVLDARGQPVGEPLHLHFEGAQPSIDDLPVTADETALLQEGEDAE